VDTKDLSPGVIAAAVILVIAIVGFLIYKGTSVKAYTGPPIDMGAQMRQRQQPMPGAPGGGTPGGMPMAPAPSGR
jgi:hypothetical protein